MEKPATYIVIDIETVPMVAEFHQLSQEWKSLWEKKMKYYLSQTSESSIEETWKTRAGIYSEFAKVVCIGVAFLQSSSELSRLHWKTFSSQEERKILLDFENEVKTILKKHPSSILAGHNIDEFDLPFLCRRFLIQGIKVPSFMPKPSSKPWSLHSFDTLKQWRFGDIKNYTSLDLLAHALHIPTSKSKMQGSEVADYYYEKKDIESIAQYCSEDLILTSQIALHFLGLPKLSQEDIHAY